MWWFSIVSISSDLLLQAVVSMYEGDIRHTGITGVGVWLVVGWYGGMDGYMSFQLDRILTVVMETYSQTKSTNRPLAVKQWILQSRYIEKIIWDYNLICSTLRFVVKFSSFILWYDVLIFCPTKVSLNRTELKLCWSSLKLAIVLPFMIFEIDIYCQLSWCSS